MYLLQTMSLRISQKQITAFWHQEMLSKRSQALILKQKMIQIEWFQNGNDS